MKAWFVELRDARPWGLATLVVLSLCAMLLYPMPAVDLLAQVSLPLMVLCLKKWNLLHCRWLYLHALLIWPLGIFLSEFLRTHVFPSLAMYLGPVDQWGFLPVLLSITGIALVVSCFTLPLLHRFTRTAASLPRLFAASALLWLVLQKSLFFLLTLVLLCTATRL